MRRRILVLATGGTIAGRQAAHGGYQAGQMAGQALLAQAGLENSGLHVEVEDIACVGSQDMSLAIWHRLAARILAAAAQGEVDGVVVAHGTDTLEETAFFLSRVLRLPFHVVLTGAMRPADAADADGPVNLRHAVLLAAEPAAGDGQVMVVFGGEIHAAQWVRKIAASSLRAFASPDAGPLGVVIGKDICWTPGMSAPHARCYALPVDAGSWPKVGILYAYAGMDCAQVQASLDLGWDGWVLAGMGNGNAPQACLAALADAARQGTVVVRSRRCLTGWVTRAAEVDDDAMGFVAAGLYDALQARTLLMLAMAETRERSVIQAHFL
ncbi:asparaginase [Kerstersia similis]|uniref:asparaginase n=1 Tax=Kerstersia similis TaxID=206505 RepID=UPI0039EEBFAA